jgi:hypothetical protein
LTPGVVLDTNVITSSEQTVRADDNQRLNAGRLGTRALDAFLELPEFRETRDRIVRTLACRSATNVSPSGRRTDA